MKQTILVSAAFFGLIGNVPALADEIFITGERRGEDALTVPGNISIIGASELRSIGADHPSEMLGRAAGVMLHRGSGQEHLTSIRSPVLTGGAGAGSFLFLENGVPLRSAGFANVNGLFEAPLALAERVEVVRGPSGAFYGANAIHGVVNVLTPEPAENFNAGSVSLSNYHTKGDFVVARENRGTGIVAGISVHADSGHRQESGSDRQSALLQVSRSVGDWSSDTIVTAINLNQETAGFIRGADAYKDDALRETNPNPEAYRDSKSFRAQSQWVKSMSEGEMRIVPFFRWTDMEFLQHFLPSKAVEENGHWSVGFQSAYYGEQGLTLGLDGEYTEGYLTEVQTLPDFFSFVQGVHYDYDIIATSISPFAQLEKPVSEKVMFTLAGRVDWTEYDYTNNVAADQVGRFVRPASRTDDFLTFSPKLGLIYTEGQHAYWLNVSAGARPPQTTDLYRLQSNQDVSDVEPEKIQSVELGWRTQRNDTFAAEIVAYFAQKENFLFRDVDGFNVVDGETEHYGVEADARIKLTDTLSLDMNGSWARHTYQFDRPVNSTANATEAIRRGDDIDTAPRTTGSARLNWMPTATVKAQAEWVHVGPYFMDASNQHEYEGHDILHLRAEREFGFATGFVNVRNALDTNYAERADFAFGSERYFPDEGRTVTIGLRYRN